VFVKWLDEKLEIQYRSPNHGNYKNPTNEVFYVLLSKKTNTNYYRAIFKEIALRFRPWDSLLATTNAELEQILRPLGLSKVRSQQILGIAKQLKQDFGKVTLSPLKRMSTSKARSYLLNLPGIGEKSARCVLMYSLGRDVSPMDTHATRIMHRLGLLPDTNPVTAHKVVDDRMPSAMAYRLHVNLVAHGKEVCRGQNPKCEICDIRTACAYFVSEGQLVPAKG